MNKYQPNRALDRAKLLILAEIEPVTLYTVDSEPFQVDGDYDGEWFSEFQWKLVVVGAGHSKYIRHAGRRDGVTAYLHNLVLPARKGYRVVHIDGDIMNNRSCNLTYLTLSEWASQRQQRTSSRLGRKHRGVIRMGFRYYTMFRGKIVPDTGSNTPEPAARIYDKMARAHWGDKAILNFPEDIS